MVQATVLQQQAASARYGDYEMNYMKFAGLELKEEVTMEKYPTPNLNAMAGCIPIERSSGALALERLRDVSAMIDATVNRLEEKLSPILRQLECQNAEAGIKTNPMPEYFEALDMCVKSFSRSSAVLNSIIDRVDL
jgi:hypothetical protein